jgi:hypothetical protein
MSSGGFKKARRDDGLWFDANDVNLVGKNVHTIK